LKQRGVTKGSALFLLGVLAALTQLLRTQSHFYDLFQDMLLGFSYNERVDGLKKIQVECDEYQ
jgi:hypothetical protein